MDDATGSGRQSSKITDARDLNSSERHKPITLDDLKIDYIATTIGIVIALPILIARLIGSALILDLGLEASIIYLPLTVLIALTLYERRRSPRLNQKIP